MPALVVLFLILNMRNRFFVRITACVLLALILLPTLSVGTAAAQADIFSLQGIGQLTATIQAVQTYCNRSLKLDGVLLTRHSGRAVLTRDMADLIKDTAEQLGTAVYSTVIREGIAVKEAQANRQSIFDYAPKSKAAADYMAFVNEYLERSGIA